MTDELKELQRQRATIMRRIAKIETEQADKRSAEVIGRFYKYSNSYGSSERWWLYFAPTKADGHFVEGLHFQRTSEGEFQITPEYSTFNSLENYTEIDAVEYGDAKAEFLTALLKAMGMTRVKDRSAKRLDRATGLDPKGESLTPKGERPNASRKSIGDVVI